MGLPFPSSSTPGLPSGRRPVHAELRLRAIGRVAPRIGMVEPQVLDGGLGGLHDYNSPGRRLVRNHPLV
eukprot:4790887-Pyramimonas_sp.AAC.1